MEYNLDILVLLLRMIFSIQLLIITVAIRQLRKYFDYGPFNKILKNLYFGIMFLSLIRVFTAFWDMYFDTVTGLFTLIADNLIYAYVTYIFLRFVNILHKTDFMSIKFNSIIDKMVIDINNIINKHE